VKPRTQGLVVLLLAAVLVRIVLTHEYLRFVRPWMRWPLLVAGLILMLMALRPVSGREPQHVTQVPRSSWLLLLPTVIVFVVAPPPLGAFLAERRPAQPPSQLPAPIVIPMDNGGGPLDIALEEFTWGAAQPDDLMGLAGQTVRMEGFVSMDKAGNWYLTRLVIFCCAADALVDRVQMVGQPAPPRDQWVRVTGTWVEGTGTDASEPAQLVAQQVVKIPAPGNPYGS
jgi:uncharacterized repeat protein (TIGR03943 family)